MKLFTVFVLLIAITNLNCMEHQENPDAQEFPSQEKNSSNTDWDTQTTISDAEVTDDSQE